MATTTQGAHAARETGMQTTQVEWVETSRQGRQVHEVAVIGDVRAATVRTYADDNSVRFWWAVTARPAGSSVEVMDSGHVASLDEARAAAVSRATWAQAALARVMTPVCIDCGASTSAEDLTDDGRCEPCATACPCATCGDTFPLDEVTDVDGDELCAACVEARGDDDDGDQCGTCAGTGIGQHGDPDTSSCHDCSSSVRRPGSDPDEAYDRYRDRDF